MDLGDEGTSGEVHDRPRANRERKLVYRKRRAKEMHIVE